jgi:hypothetical protein
LCFGDGKIGSGISSNIWNLLLNQRDMRDTAYGCGSTLSFFGIFAETQSTRNEKKNNRKNNIYIYIYIYRPLTTAKL